MAEGIFNNFSKKNIAASARINSPEKWESQKLSKTEFVAPCMNDIEINIDKKVSRRLAKEMVKEADKIIVMEEKDN